VVQSSAERARIDRDRSALRVQLVALEEYYEMKTAELVARVETEMVPERIPLYEAARWAELYAELRRTSTQARRIEWRAGLPTRGRALSDAHHCD
jgi:hypothetical protein